MFINQRLLIYCEDENMLNIDAEFNELMLIFRPNSRGLGAIGEFGEFGMALSEISAVEQEIHAQWRDVVRSGLGELADIKQDIEASKKIISSSLDIGGKIEALKSRISRLQTKLSKVKNPAAKAKIQEKINAATPQLNIAQGAYNAMQAAIGMAKEVLAKAGIVVEEAKKAVVETAAKAREKALELTRKAKEVALMVGKKVKETAAAAAAAAKAAAKKVKIAADAAKKAALQKAAQAKAMALQVAAKAKAVAEQARAVAAQKAAQAKAMAVAAAQRVQQAAAAARARAIQIAQQAQARAVQVAQQARQAVVQRAVQTATAAKRYVAPVAQKTKQAVSTVKSWFGFKGLGELGIDPVTGLIAVGSAVAIAQAALAAANMFTGQGEAVPVDAGIVVPETIPAAAMEQYKVAASECYNSAVAQGYIVDTPEKEALLNKTCRERAAAQYAAPSEIPYTDKALIDEFEVPPTEVPGIPSAYLPGGTPLEQMCAADPTNPQCVGITPIQLPEGGGYYTTGEEPIISKKRIIYPEPGVIPPAKVEPGIYDEFETLVPGVRPVPGYPPGIPTTVSIPGVTPTYPGYEPGMAPTYAPGVEIPEAECPDLPEMTDDEYCSNFPQCCEDVPKGCPDIPEITDSEYCAAYPQCCEESGVAKTGVSPWEFDTGMFGL